MVLRGPVELEELEEQEEQELLCTLEPVELTWPSISDKEQSW
jgi:hypothetical protein